MIAIGSDHGGFALKQAILKHLEKRGESYHDFGTYSQESCDYPDFGKAVARAVAGGEYEYGIIICGTGIGISMVCNKHKGIRAALCNNEYMARMCRQHNDANVLAFGARVVGPEIAFAMVDCFFEEEFAGGRHAERVGQMKQTEEENFK